MTNRNSRIVTIIALVIGVLALTIGFAAFTQTLSINNSAAEVKPSNSLNVHFPTSGTVTPTVVGTGVSGASLTLNNGTTITGLKGNFNAPGQSVTYNTTIINDSSYAAYLTAVTFSKSSASCSPLTGSSNPASSSTLTAVCGNMKMHVTVGSSGSYLVNDATSTQATIAGKSIAAGSSVPVVVKLEYTGSAVPDGDFSVDFGNISFAFNSTDVNA